MARKSHQDSAVRLVTAKRGPGRAIKTRQYDLLRPRVGQKMPPRLGSTICYGQTWARRSHQDKSWPEKSPQNSAERFVAAKSWPERATETRQYDLLRPRVVQKTTKTHQYDLLQPKVDRKEPPRLGSTICYGQSWPEGATKTRQYGLLRPTERATETRQYDLSRPRVGQKEPPRLGSTICYGQELARKSHQDSAVRFVTAKRGPEKATKTRQYDLLRPNVGQKEPPRLGSTICYGQTWARKSHQDSAVRFVTAKRGPERATKTRQYDLLRPNVGQKEPPRLGSTICYGQELARKSHQDSAARFVTAKSWPENATKTRQYDLLRPRVVQKEPPRLGSTICCGQELARKSHQDSAVRFDTAKSWPEGATKTRQYGLLRPNVDQKEPPRLGSTICHGQELARKSHRDSAVRFVTAKSWPEKATKTRQYDLLRPRVGQKKPLRLGSTIYYGQTWARKSHQDSAVRFVTAKRVPEKATKTRQYDLLRPNVGQKEPPRLRSTICYGQTWARKSHRDSAVRYVTAKSWPERATKTRQYDLLRPRVGQKMPPRLGSTICYGQELARKSHQDSAVRFVTAKSWPEKATKTRQYDLLRPRVGQKKPLRLGSTIYYGQTWARKSHQDSAVRFVTAKRVPEKATETRQYDLLRPNVGQKEPPRLGSTICYGQELARMRHVGQKEPPRLGSTICYGQELARKSYRDLEVRFATAKSWPKKAGVRFVTAKSWPERVTETRQYDLLRPRVGQKKPPRLGSTICYGQELARKSHQDSAVRLVTAKRGPERATKTRQYDLLRPNVGQKEPPRLGNTICYGQELAPPRLANTGPERAIETWQYDLIRPNVGQKTPPRLGSTICYGQELAPPRLANTGPERAIETWQYDLIRPNVGQKTPPRLGSTICYGQELARKSHQDLAVRFVTANSKSHQDSAVRFVTAKSWPEGATKTRQYDLLQTCARKSQQDSAVRFVTAKSWPEKATKTRQYDMLRPRVGQKEPPRLGSTICYGQELARKSHQDSAVRFVTAKRWPEKATKTRQYDLLRPRVGQRKPPRLGSTICYGQQREPPRFGSTICYGQELSRKSHRDSAVRFATAKRGPERATKTRQHDLLRTRVGQKEPPRLGSTIRYGQTWARKSHRDSAVRFVTAKSWPERATETRQYDLLRPRVGQKEPPRLGSTICYGQTWARKSHQDSDLLRPRVGQKEPPRLGSAICYLLRPRVWPERATKTRQYDLLWPNVCQAKSWPERAPKIRQYDLLRPRLGQKEPPRLDSTICYGQELARKSHRDSAVRFVTAKRGPERATKTRQYDLLRPRVGQKEPPRLGSTICYGQELARKSHQDSAVRFVTKRGPERATKTRQYDLLRPRVGQKEPPRLGSTICYGQTWARKSHQDSAVRLVTAKRGPERATKTR